MKKNKVHYSKHEFEPWTDKPAICGYPFSSPTLNFELIESGDYQLHITNNLLDVTCVRCKKKLSAKTAENLTREK